MSWRRSTFCANNGCIDVKIEQTTVLMRSSDSPGHVLVFTHEEWRAFVAGAKDGEFDLERAEGVGRGGG